MKLRHKSNFKRKPFASVLQKEESRQILKDEREDGEKKMRLLKPQELAGGYQSQTDRATGTVVVSKKPEPWSFGAIDIE